MCRHIGQEFCSGGRTDLVVDDPQLISLGRQPQHSLGKVGAARGINPTGTEGEVFRTPFNRVLAVELGPAVDAQRIGGTDSGDEYGTTEIDVSQYRGSSCEGGD